MNKNEYQIMYDIEDSYWWYSGLHDLIEYFLRKKAKTSTAPLSILDAGCGTGRLMERAQRFGAVEGFDFSEEALRYCNLRGLKLIHHQDITTWIPPKERYDVVLSLDVLCHRSIEEVSEVINKLFDSLKKGGLCLINVPAFEALKRTHDEAVHTKRRFRRKETVELFRAAGFKIVRGTYRLPYLFFIILLNKGIDLILPPRSIRSDLRELTPWINKGLYFMHRAENILIESGVSLPLGSSLFLVAQK